MSEIKYATRMEKENIAKVYGRSLNISTKQGVEICSFIRGKKTSVAKELLDKAISMKQAIPIKRFTGDTGHRKGIYRGPGRYMVKCATAIKKLIESAEANATFKGLEVKNLVIAHSCAHRAAAQWRYGRHHRRKMKVTHVEIVVEEVGEKKPAKTAPAKEKKAEPVKKAEPKPLEKKAAEPAKKEAAEKPAEPANKEKAEAPKKVDAKTEEKA